MFNVEAFLAGTKVRAVDLDGNVLGNGTLMTDYVVDADDNPRPLIKLANGRVISGDDCHWLPLSRRALDLVGASE